jgi:transposase-like protein
MNTEKAPTTLLEAARYFSDPDGCLKHLTASRWRNGVVCPRCGAREVYFLKTRRVWKCKAKHAKQQFSAKVGTIFEDSPIGLDKWFAAAWLLANCKNDVSSHEVARDLGVTQKTAWFMLQRLRLAMQGRTGDAMSGPLVPTKKQSHKKGSEFVLPADQAEVRLKRFEEALGKILVAPKLERSALMVSRSHKARARSPKNRSRKA